MFFRGRPNLPSSQLTTNVPLDLADSSRLYSNHSKTAEGPLSVAPALSTNDRPPPLPLVSSTHQDLTYSSVLHYETSFQSGKHGMIKNIKFKVPACYTNLFKTSTVSNDNNNSVQGGDSKTGNASVIVNNSAVGSSDIHWRRRTSQNLVLKN